MAFLKFAYASTSNPSISRQKWLEIREAAKSAGQIGRVAKIANNSLIGRAEEILNQPFSPKNYLLTHATIVASVDTYVPHGMKTGNVLEDGFRVNRRYADFRIKPACDMYINNNNDAWSRPVLLKSFETFIGGQNFVEHVQLEEQSKGRILDAVARDIGDSVYVDILIATDRKHSELVKAISSGKMSTLSMGCTISGSQCTKCGHWAADETETCPHIRYAKGTKFFDEMGRSHRIAELCGNAEIDPNGGVQFIEASWVETPAFQGAALRNVIDLTPEISAKAAKILATPPREWSKSDKKKKASADGFLAGWEDDSGVGEPPAEEEEAPAKEEGGESEESPLKETESDLTDYLVNQVKKRVKKDIQEQDTTQTLNEPSTAPNDNIQKEAAAQIHAQAIELLVKTASNDAFLIDGVATLDKAAGIDLNRSLYRTALKVSSKTPPDKFLEACASVLGRKPSQEEGMVLTRLSSLIARRSQDLRVDKPLVVVDRRSTR